MKLLLNLLEFVQEEAFLLGSVGVLRISVQVINRELVISFEVCRLCLADLQLGLQSGITVH